MVYGVAPLLGAMAIETGAVTPESSDHGPPASGPPASRDASADASADTSAGASGTDSAGASAPPSPSSGVLDASASDGASYAPPSPKVVSSVASLAAAPESRPEAARGGVT